MTYIKERDPDSEAPNNRWIYRVTAEFYVSGLFPRSMGEDEVYRILHEHALYENRGRPLNTMILDRCLPEW